ncbi:MAG: A/G-specific adenine glycosylase [Deltaproteobacteria bacterium]|nr:A/G-specific adenine glycosylase [Deltaproteobacteria bacterium]
MHQRRLPWRDDPSPYRVWVSEIMLQQTQVATVIPYFERFVAAFPTVDALAAADLSDVLTLWSGLGYYRRARLLHAAAREVVDAHGGRLPSTVEGLLGLPGVGRYTAGAIASIAFSVRAPVLDGNVMRVLSRLDAVDAPVDAAATQRALWARAEALVPADDPSAHNQAMMELGALVCTPRAPDCPACPWVDACAAHARGAAHLFPKKSPKAPARAVSVVAGLLGRSLADDAVLLARRPEDGLFGGLWELPATDLEARRAPASPRAALARAFRDRLGLDVDVGPHLAGLTHQLTHRTLSIDVFRVTAARGADPRPSWYTEARWVPRSAPDAVPLSTLTRKVLAAVGAA